MYLEFLQRRIRRRWKETKKKIMKKKLITIIVPIYNVSDYLERCLKSIIKQTYKNLEIILVDDGSTDGSSLICDEYALKDNRIKVIHKKNGGLSDARNKGIDIANGEYIMFVDSDDYIALDLTKFLYNSLVKNKADISTCLYQCFHDKEDVLDFYDNTEYVCSNTEALEKMLYQKNCTTSAWGKLYKASLFEDIRYPKDKICEDLDTTYLLFSKASKVVINTIKKYFYFQRSSSIINSKFNPKRMDALNFAKKQTDYIIKNHPNIFQSAMNREFMEAIFILGSMDNLNDNNDYINSLNNTIKATRKIVLFDSKSRKLYRLYALISYFGINALFYTIKFKMFLKR